jgi:DnaA family protein
LSLRFPLRREYSFASFEPGGSAEALQRLSTLARDPGFVGLWLWGAAAVGKTHLLHATCQLQGGRVGYLPLIDLLADSDPIGGLASSEPLDLLALDDLDHWLGDLDRERALQGVYQAQVNHGGKLLVTSVQAPSVLAIQLPDLASRLRALSCYQLQPLTDVTKKRLLQDRAKERGLLVADNVLDFWLSRGDRNLASLLEQLRLVTDVALRQQRRITVPLLKDVLQF